MALIKTIEDLENYYYGPDWQMLFKDAPVLTSTTGARNVRYGPRLWSQVVTEYNVLGALRKEVYDKGGYRAATAASATSGGNITEGAAIPATVKSTYAHIPIGIKKMAHSFDMSDVDRALEGKDDTMSWAEFAELEGNVFKNLLNRRLCANVATAAAGTSIESIDRVTSSYTELNSCSLTANYADIYTDIDRDSASTHIWADAQLSHGSGTARYLELSHIDDVIAAAMPYWSNGFANKWILTGYDTMFRISKILQPQQRFTGPTETKVSMGVNGVASAGKEDTGFITQSYQYMPIIASNNVVQDTISRLYVLDSDHLWFANLTPIIYSEVGNTQEEQQAIDKFVTEGVYSMAGELVCTLFKAQGKVRDLK